MPHLFRAPITTIGALLVVASLVACGSGGSVTSAPQVAPSASAAAASQTVTTSTTTTTAIPGITSAGITTTAILPAGNTAATVTESVTTKPPGRLPALDLTRAAAQRGRAALSGADLAILYVGFVSSPSVTLNGTPSLTFTFPVPAGQSYYLATYESSGWVYPTAGPGSISGSNVTFASTSAATTLSSTPLYIALYSVATGASASPSAAPSASPSPSASLSPSPSPSPSPTLAPVAAPTTLTFSANAPSTQTFTVTEAGDTAAYTVAIVCSAASPAPGASPAPSPAPSGNFVAVLGSTTAASTGGVGTFAVTSGSELGTCQITVTDFKGAMASVTVNVDETGINAYSTHRRAH